MALVYQSYNQGYEHPQGHNNDPRGPSDSKEGFCLSGELPPDHLEVMAASLFICFARSSHAYYLRMTFLPRDLVRILVIALVSRRLIPAFEHRNRGLRGCNCKFCYNADVVPIESRMRWRSIWPIRYCAAPVCRICTDSSV